MFIKKMAIKANKNPNSLKKSKLSLLKPLKAHNSP